MRGEPSSAPTCNAGTEMPVRDGTTRPAARGHFQCGNERDDMRAMIDCAADIMELWNAEGPYNVELRKQWIARAKELGIGPSP